MKPHVEYWPPSPPLERAVVVKDMITGLVASAFIAALMAVALGVVG